jgi:hypothetical protein
MAETVLDRRGTILARQLWLAPGEAMPWDRTSRPRAFTAPSTSAKSRALRIAEPLDRP